MSVPGLGYDFSSAMFSPEGRILQVEYATKAAEAGAVSIGLRLSDSALLVSEIPDESRLRIRSPVSESISIIGPCIGISASGHFPDAKRLVFRARHDVKKHMEVFGTEIPPSMLVDRLSLYVNAHTLYSGVRPFGIEAIVMSHGPDGFGIHAIDPFGNRQGYFACAIGKGKHLAKTELERLDITTLCPLDALRHIIKIMYETRGGDRNKVMVAEAAWITKETNNAISRVSDHVVAEMCAEIQRSMQCE